MIDYLLFFYGIKKYMEFNLFVRIWAIVEAIFEIILA